MEIGDYVLEKEIGKGSFASVRTGYHKITGTKVAIKTVSKQQNQEADFATRFTREVEIIKELNHPFVAEFFALLEDSTNFYVIMEMVENGNLLDFVNKGGELDENLARHYFCQLISVLEYIHVQMSIVHRDLKAENVLLDRNYNIRLIDFGLSNKFTPDDPFLTTACGSPAYASPEMVKGQQYTAASDIWSAGVLLYAMCAGELPYEDENVQRLLQKIAFTDPHYPSHFSVPLKDLIQKMLAKEPSRRITIPKIKEHPWFSQYEYSKMMNKNFGVSLHWRVRRTAQSEDAVDREIITQMTEYGIDCQPLVNSILCGETTPLTAIYRMLRKEKITNLMEEIAIKSERTVAKKLPPARPLPPPSGNGEKRTVPAPVALPRRRPSFCATPETAKVPTTPIKTVDRRSCELTPPTAVQMMQRRGSMVASMKNASPRGVVTTPLPAVPKIRARSSSMRDSQQGPPTDLF